MRERARVSRAMRKVPSSEAIPSVASPDAAEKGMQPMTRVPLPDGPRSTLNSPPNAASR